MGFVWFEGKQNVVFEIYIFSSYILTITVSLRGVKHGQKLNQEHDRKKETAQYQSQNVEFPNQENAYITPCQPTNTCETSQKQELELAVYDEIKENHWGILIKHLKEIEQLEA